jgi:hypothetical protein
MTVPAGIPATVANSLSEANFQQQVLDLATVYGWRHFHVRDSRRSDPGWPDLVLLRPPKLLIVELKRETGRLSVAQSDWLRLLEMCGVDVRVWRPSSWPDIEATLKPGERAMTRGP